MYWKTGKNIYRSLGHRIPPFMSAMRRKTSSVIRNQCLDSIDTKVAKPCLIRRRPPKAPRKVHHQRLCAIGGNSGGKDLKSSKFKNIFVEMGGFDPPASRMQSERSANWSTSPFSHPAGFEPALPGGNGLAGRRVNHSAKDAIPIRNKSRSYNTTVSFLPITTKLKRIRSLSTKTKSKKKFLNALNIRMSSQLTMLLELTL